MTCWGCVVVLLAGGKPVTDPSPSLPHHHAVYLQDFYARGNEASNARLECFTVWKEEKKLNRYWLQIIIIYLFIYQFIYSSINYFFYAPLLVRQNSAKLVPIALKCYAI